jgi:hypothetical protein
VVVQVANVTHRMDWERDRSVFDLVKSRKRVSTKHSTYLFSHEKCTKERIITKQI